MMALLSRCYSLNIYHDISHIHAFEFVFILSLLPSSYKPFLRADSKSMPDLNVVFRPWLWRATCFLIVSLHCDHFLEDTISFSSTYLYNPGRYFSSFSRQLFIMWAGTKTPKFKVRILTLEYLPYYFPY